MAGVGGHKKLFVGGGYLKVYNHANFLQIRAMFSQNRQLKCCHTLRVCRIMKENFESDFDCDF